MRRNLLLLTSLAASALALVLLAGFVWPEGYPQDFVNLGPAEDYAPGSVTMHEDLVEFTDDRWDVDVLMESLWAQSAREVSVALARHEDGSFSAFLARDPRNACPLRWRTNFMDYDPDGVFRDPCHCSSYDGYGRRVYGPSPRNMDYFDVEVNAVGDVIVDLRELHEGAYTPAYFDGTPYPTASAVAP